MSVPIGMGDRPMAQPQHVMRTVEPRDERMTAVTFDPLDDSIDVCRSFGGILRRKRSMKRQYVRSAAVAVCILGQCTTDAWSQASSPVRTQRMVTHVPTNVSCTRCDIRVKEGTIIGRDDEDGALTSWPDVVLGLRGGRYLVAGGQGEESVPRVFSARGEFERRIGREGAGPGEFRGIKAAFVWHDSLFLFDRGNARMAVLSPAFAVHRYSPAPTLVYSADAMRTGFALSGPIRDAQRVGYPVHLFSQRGEYLRPLGDSAETVTLRSGLRPFVISRARDGGVWTVPMWGGYELRRWSADGTLQSAFVVHSDWYKSAAPHESVTPSSSPMAQISRVYEAEDGLVWVLALVADPAWHRGLGPAVMDERRVGYPIVDRSKVFDAIVEIIDPSAGRIVARRRFDLPFQYVVRPGEIGRYDESGVDGPRLHTVWLSLSGR